MIKVTQDLDNYGAADLEKELKDLNGVKKMTSASYQDMSMIMVEFETDVEVEQAKWDVKDKVDNAKRELPDDLDSDPVVNDIDLAEFPVLNINLSGDYSIIELKKFAEDLQDDFESLKEIREAKIKGVDEREIKIHVDPHKMSAYDLSFMDIEMAVQSENITMGAGEVVVDGTRRSIRVQADYTKAREEAREDRGRTPPQYQVTRKLLKEKAQRHAIVLHSLPRMDELLTDVDSTRHARYWIEAFNGVVLRMALLSLILGAME